MLIYLTRCLSNHQCGIFPSQQLLEMHNPPFSLVMMMMCVFFFSLHSKFEWWSGKYEKGGRCQTPREREITGNNNDGDGYVLSIDGELYYIIHWVIHVGNVVIWCENRTLGRRCSFVVVGTHRYRAQNTWLHLDGRPKNYMNTFILENEKKKTGDKGFS